MKKISLIALLSLLFLFNKAEALLPPFYQTLKEYKALLDDPQFNNSFDSADVIMDIKREDESFIITTNKHRLKVDIETQPTGRPGPKEFILKFNKPEPLPAK